MDSSSTEISQARHNNNNNNSNTNNNSSSSPADLVREIEALRARTLALQRKIDSTATGINQQQMLEEKRQNAEIVKKTDKVLTEAHQKEKEIQTQEQRVVNEKLKRSWSQQRLEALEKYRQHRKNIHDQVAEEDKTIQELAKKRIAEQTERRHETANRVRHASKKTVAEQRQQVLDEAQQRNKEENEITKTKLSQYEQDVANDLEEARKRKQQAKAVREALAAAAKAKIEKQREEFHQKELDLKNKLAQVKEIEEERRRSVSARAKRTKEESERKRLEAERRVKNQRLQEVQRIRQRLAEELKFARDARDQQAKEHAEFVHHQERAMVETIKRVQSADVASRNEQASQMRILLKEASQKRSQSDSARTTARSRQRIGEASASRERYQTENSQKLNRIVDEGKEERTIISQEVQRRRELDAIRKKRCAELIRKEEGEAQEVIRRTRHHDPSEAVEVHESRRQWEETKKKREEERQQLHGEVLKRRQEEKQVQEKLKQELVSDIEKQRSEKRQDRAKLMETLLERKRIMEAQLAQVEAASMSRTRTNRN